MNRQSMSDSGYSMLGVGAWGWPTEMWWGGRGEGGSRLGTHVRIKDFKIKKIKKLKIKSKGKNYIFCESWGGNAMNFRFTSISPKISTCYVFKHFPWGNH